jgi:ankyrin repeat protein
MIRHFKFIFQVLVAAGFSCAHAGAYDDLFVAVIRDDASGLTRLLRQGVDPNTRDPKGMPALSVAVKRESPKAFEILLAHPGIDVDAPNAAGETALMLTAIAGDLEASQHLVARGAKLQLPGWSPIHYAASGPNTTLTQWLLDRGAQVDAESPNGTTPLMLAAQHAPEGTVELLLKRGADPRRRNQRGLQAIDYAEMGGRDFLVERFEKLPR